MTHEVYIDLSGRSTPSIRTKLIIARVSDEPEMVAACLDELARRHEELSDQELGVDTDEE